LRARRRRSVHERAPPRAPRPRADGGRTAPRDPPRAPRACAAGRPRGHRRARASHAAPRPGAHRRAASPRLGPARRARPALGPPTRRALSAVRSSLAAVLLLAAAACRHERRPALRLWALGREGEVVAQLLPDLARRRPGLRVRVQQIPWSAAHEKLLTAFVGGAMPDVLQVGNTWLPELVALGALEPLDHRLARSVAVRADDYFPGILAANVIDGVTYGVPWYVDTRLLFYRTDLLAAAGFARPPTTWAGWLAALPRMQAAAGPGNWAILLPLREWEPPVILGMQWGAGLLRDGDRYGDFESPAFRAAFAFYLDFFHRGLAPLGDTAARARRHRAGGLARRRLEPRGRPQLAAQGRRLGARRVSRRAGTAGAVLPAHRRPAGAPERLGGRGPPRRCARAGLLAAVATRAADPQDPGVGAHRERDRAVRGGGHPRRDGNRRRARGARPGRRPGAREAALAARAATAVRCSGFG